jgi:hypothetical protein
MNTRDDTQDIRRYRRRPDDPHATEARTRRFGVICLAAGITLPVLVYLAGMVVAVLSENDAFHQESARLFAVLGMIALIGLGFMLTAIGGAERLHRPTRAAADRNRILLERNSLEQREFHENLAGLVAALPGRLAAVEDGQRRLVDVLPEEIQRKYWSGFNAAVQEGFRATGTDGKGRSGPPRLGLVPPDDPPRA